MRHVTRLERNLQFIKFVRIIEDLRTMWKSVTTRLFQCQYSTNFLNQRFASNGNRKWLKKDEKFPYNKSNRRRTDPGLRKQAKALDPHGSFDEEDYENELDIMKVHKLYNQHQSFRQDHKEFVKMKTVQQKYFKIPQERKLSWSDKEHIRYLHNTDPEMWTFEMISDQFNIDQEVAKRIATAKWIPKQNKISTVNNQMSEVQVTESRNANSPRLRPRDSQKRMTLTELQRNIGVEQKKEEEIILKHEAEPMHNPENDPKSDILIQFFSKNHPPVWMEKKSNLQPKVCLVF